MSSIDQRIVGMQFDNSQFERGVKETLSSIEKLKDNLDFSKAEKSMDSLQKAGNSFSIARMANGVEALANRFSTLGIVGMRVLENLADKATEAGERLIKSLTTDQISAGFSKYEEYSKSMKTIISATGKPLAEVQGELDKLLWFTDETSYSLLDMTNNIGKFTSNGVDLTIATSAMMGIADAAALAGSGIESASHAMEGFSKGIAQGKMTRATWQWVKTARMDTQKFKESIIEAAVEVGTLQKKGEGYATKKGTAVSFDDFETAMVEGWFNKDVILKALGKYGDFAGQLYDLIQLPENADKTTSQVLEELGEEYEGLGRDAFLAAQEARTFSDAIQSVKDAVSTGWMKTFEFVIGDTEQATELWTDLANALWEIFASGGEKRNELLSEWNELGGRDDLIQGLYDTFAGLVNILDAVKSAFHEIFPEATVDDLLKISSAVKEFGANLKSATTIGKIFDHWETEKVTVTHDTIESLNEELKRGSKGEDVERMQKRLMELGINLDKYGADGIFGPETQAALKEFQEKYGLTVSGIYDEATHLKMAEVLGLDGKTETRMEKVAKYIDDLPPGLERVQRILKGLFAVLSIGKRFLGFGFEGLKRIGSALSPIGNLFLDLAAAAGDFFVQLDQNLANTEMFDEWLSSLDAFLEPIKGKLEAFRQTVLNMLGLGEGGEDSVAEAVDPTAFLDGIKEKVAIAFDSFKNWISSFTENFDSLDFMTIVVGALTTILSGGIISAIVNFVKTTKQVTTFFKNLTGTTKQIKNFAKTTNFQRIAEGLKQIAIAVGILAAVVFVFSRLSIGDLIKGIVGMAIVLGMLIGSMAILMKIVSKSDMKNLDKLSKILLPFAESIAILAASVAALSFLSIEGLIKGLVGLGVILLGFTLALRGIMSAFKDVDPKVIGKISGLLNAFSQAVNGLAIVVIKLGKMDVVSLIKGLAGLGALMLGLTLTMRAISKATPSVGTIIGLIAVAAALGVLMLTFSVMVLAMRGSSVGAVFKAIGSLAAIVLAVGGLMAIMQRVKPSIGSIVAMIPIAAALGVLMLTFSVMVLAMRGTSTGAYLKAIGSLAMIVIAIAGLMFIMQRVKPSIGSIVALIPIAVALGTLMLTFSIMVLAIRGSRTRDIWMAINGLTTIVLSIAGLLFVMDRLKPSIGSIVALIPIAVALGTLMLSFSIMVLAMKFASISDVIKAVAGLAIIVVAIGGLMAFMQRVKPSIGSIIALIPVAIALGSLMLAFSIMVIAMRNASIKSIVGAIVGLMAIVASLGLLMKLISGVKPSIRGILALVPMAIALDILVLGFVKLLKVTKKASFKNLAKAIFGILACVAALAILSKAANHIKPSIKGILALIPLAIALDLIVVGFAFALKMVKDVDFSKIIAFALGLSAMLTALTFAVKSFGSMSIPNLLKGVFAIAATLAILAAAIALIVWGFGKLDEVTGGGFLATIERGAKTIKAMANALNPFGLDIKTFGIAFGALLAACTGAGFVAGKMITGAGAIAATLGIIAFAIGLIISGLGALDTISIDGTTGLIEKGCSTISTIGDTFSPIGEHIETFAGIIGGLLAACTGAGFVAGKMLVGGLAISGTMGSIAMTIGLVVAGFGALDSISIDGDTGLIEKGCQAISAIGDLLAPAGDDIGVFAGAIAALLAACTASGFVAGQMFVGGLAISGTLGSIASCIGLVVAGFGALDSISIDGDTGLIEKGCQAISAIGDLLAPAGDDIGVFAGAIAALLAACTASGFVAGQMFVGGLAISGTLGAIATSVGLIVGGFGALDELTDGEVVESITRGGEVLSSIGEALGSFVGTLSGSVVGSFNATKDKIETVGFAETFAAFNDQMSQIPDTTGLTEKTQSAIDIATAVSNLSTQLEGKTIGTAIKDFFTGTAMENLESDMGTFADGINKFVTGLGEITADAGTISQAQGAVTVAETIAQFLAKLSSDEYKIDKDGWFYTGNVTTFKNNLSDFGTAIHNFTVNATADNIDPSVVESFANSLETIANALLKVDLLTNAKESAENLTTEITEISGAFSGSNAEQLKNAAANLMSSISEGMSSATLDTSKISGICDSALSIIDGYQSRFQSTGRNLAAGLAAGIASGASLVIAAAIGIATAAIAAANLALLISSPSRVFEEIGMYCDMGLANGFVGYANVITKASKSVANSAIDSMRDPLMNLTSLISDDMDYDPVIRPVMDLTSVQNGARAIGGMLGGRYHIGLNEQNLDNAASAARGVASINRRRQNEMTETGSSSAISEQDSSVNLTGNNFYVRSEQDIRSLATEIASLTRQQQRSLGTGI